MIAFLIGVVVMCVVCAFIHSVRWADTGEGGWLAFWNLAGAAVATVAIPVVLIGRLVT